MVRLTIALEEKLLEEVRRKAREQGTSVDDLLRSYLESYVRGSRQQIDEAIQSLLDLSSKAQSGSEGRRWTRDEVYER